MIIDNFSTVKHEISQVAAAVVRNGWGEATSGNFSWNITKEINKKTLADLPQAELQPTMDTFPELGGQVLLISASGSRMRTLAEGFSLGYCLLVMSKEGNGYHCIEMNGNHSEVKPTSEISAHLEVHRQLKITNQLSKAVLHTHMTEAVMITHHSEYKFEKKLNSILRAMQPEMMTFLSSGVGVLPYELPGSQKIGKATARKIKDYDVVFWEKHGCFSVGSTLNEALDKQEIVAKSLHLFFSCLQCGYQPEGLTEKQLIELKKALG